MFRLSLASARAASYSAPTSPIISPADGSLRDSAASPAANDSIELPVIDIPKRSSAPEFANIVATTPSLPLPPTWDSAKLQQGLQHILKPFPENSIRELIQELSAKAVRSPLEKNTLLTLQILLELCEGTSAALNNRYMKFIDQWRMALKTPEFEVEVAKLKRNEPADQCADILLQLCQHRFTEVYLYPLSSLMVVNMIQDGIRKMGRKLENSDEAYQLPLEDQFEAITKAEKEIGWLEQFRRRLPGALNVLYDSHRDSNMPSVFFDFALGEAQFRILRLGTPTIQGTTWSMQTDINPEFRHFINALEIQDRKFLYVSLQDEQPRQFADESGRNTALKRLREDTPNHFFFSVIPQDNDFYYQKNTYANENDAVAFKTSFKRMLNMEELGYWFPEEWKAREDFMKTLFDMLDEVHEDLYENKPILDLKDRWDFIEIFNARLTLFLLTYTKVNYACISCKDSKDRAIKSNVILMQFLSILARTDEDIEQTKAITVAMHAPALLDRQQAMNIRKDRLISVMKRLKDEGIKTRLRERLSHLNTDGFTIPLES